MTSDIAMPRCFKISASDNVATLLGDAERVVEIIGAPGERVQLLERISLGHKVALHDIAAGEAVVKFGVRIGRATQPIQRGAWVHLHNLASDLDERSTTLDVHSGAPTDTEEAYK